jgi:hypothetical protein
MDGIPGNRCAELRHWVCQDGALSTYLDGTIRVVSFHLLTRSVLVTKKTEKSITAFAIVLA